MNPAALHETPDAASFDCNSDTQQESGALLSCNWLIDRRRPVVAAAAAAAASLGGLRRLPTASARHCLVASG